MAISAHETSTVQNLGLADRVIRFSAGAALMGYAAYDLVQGAAFSGWHAFAMLAAVYPLMTGMLGWGPFYAMLGVKSCGVDGRNQCGSFPYEVRSALGRAPKECNVRDGRSLGNCR